MVLFGGLRRAVRGAVVRAQRVAVASVVYSVVTVFALAVSTAIYAAMYQSYVPPVAHSLPVFFDYDTPNTHPIAVVPLTTPYSNSLDDSLLAPGHRYRFSVELAAPETRTNSELGNFMVTLDLRTIDGLSLARSTRPASLILHSDLLKFVLYFIQLLPQALGYLQDGQLLHVTLMERFLEPTINGTNHAVLSLSSSKVHVYQANLKVEATFVGVVYFMYHWKILTALIFIPLIAIWVIFVLYTLLARLNIDSSPVPSRTKRVLDNNQHTTTSSSSGRASRSRRSADITPLRRRAGPPLY